MIQSGGFLGRLLGPLLKAGLPLIKIAIKTFAKSVLIPLGLLAAESAADAGIHKKNLRFWSSFGLCFAYNNTNNIKLWNERNYENS